MTRVHVAGGGTYTLSSADFVGSGGEGDVYARGDVAFKVHHDPTTVPLDKVRALRAIDVPDAIVPDALLTDDGGQVVGYTMPFVAGTHPLCRLFSQRFCDRHGVDADRLVEICRRLRSLVDALHARNVVVVDLNELNVLTDLKRPVLVDAASWQLPGHPATAIMETIRDRHATGFDAASDWFAFAVLTFQLFTGIHPYRGKHPTLPDLDSRMHGRHSVLRGDVVVPPSARIDALPDAWRAWYAAVLDGPTRSPPPARVDVPVWVPRTTTGGAVRSVVVRTWPARLRSVVRGAALTDVGVFVNRDLTVDAADVLLASPTGRPVAGHRANGMLRLIDARDGSHLLHLGADEVVGNVLRRHDRLIALQVHDVGDRLLVTPQVVGHVLPHATRLFDGLAVQNLARTCWITRLPGGQIAVPELDGLTIVDAVARGSVVVLTVRSDVGYDRVVLRFRHGRYDLRRTPDVEPTGVDLEVTGNGIAVLYDGAQLELFEARPGRSDVRVVDAPNLGRIVTVGGRMHALLGRQLRSITLT